MVKMDEFLATRMFFLGQNFAKNRAEVSEISPVKKTLVPGEFQFGNGSGLFGMLYLVRKIQTSEINGLEGALETSNCRLVWTAMECVGCPVKSMCRRCDSVTCNEIVNISLQLKPNFE
jgi:hypothetical protein